MAPGYNEAIRDLIDQFSLSPDLSSSKREQLEAFVARAQADGANFEFPQRLLDDQKRNYKDLPIHDFEIIVQKVREIQKAGIEEQKNRDQARRTKTAIRVDSVVNAVMRSPGGRQTLETRGRREGARRAYNEAKLLLLNADSILKDLDQFQDLGPVYEAVKGNIDRSVSNGYGSETNIGLVNRQKKIAEDLLELYKVFTKEEMNTLSRVSINVPNFDGPISRNVQLSILLNSGNGRTGRRCTTAGR